MCVYVCVCVSVRGACVCVCVWHMINIYWEGIQCLIIGEGTTYMYVYFPVVTGRYHILC